MEQQIQNASNFNPLALAMLLVMVYLTWSLPRRFAICPLLVTTCLIPLGQDLVLFDLHFRFFRILLLVGMLRVVIKGEAAQMKWTRTDKVMAWWIIVSVIFGSLSKPSMDLFVNRLGDAFNAIGCYYFARCVIVSFEDVITSVRTLAWLSLPVALLMIVERITMHNPFAVFGGVPVISPLRDGHVRAQGAFRHAILAGTFGATQFPLFVGLWFYQRKYRPLAVAGCIAALCITITASTSGAVLALMGGVGGLALWKWRAYMRLIRWSFVVLMILLSLMMKAPVWYLFARISEISGGSGWYRSYIIDQAVAHFDQWWLFGTTYTANWAPAGEVIAADPNMMDITNQFVMEGVKGGLLKLLLFIAIIVGCFKIVGKSVRSKNNDVVTRFFIWSFGASLFGHSLTFMSVPYFDQIIVIWYWLLAVIAGISAWNLTASVSEAS
jgi:hypothetical protein